MKLKQVATIKTNFENADFWIIRRGSVEKVGTPVKSFFKEHIGIRVFRTDILLSGYLFYAMMHIHQEGLYKAIAKGTLALVHITV